MRRVRSRRVLEARELLLLIVESAVVAVFEWVRFEPLVDVEDLVGVEGEIEVLLVTREMIEVKIACVGGRGKEALINIETIANGRVSNRERSVVEELCTSSRICWNRSSAGCSDCLEA